MEKLSELKKQWDDAIAAYDAKHAELERVSGELGTLQLKMNKAQKVYESAEFEARQARHKPTGMQAHILLFIEAGNELRHSITYWRGSSSDHYLWSGPHDGETPALDGRTIKPLVDLRYFRFEGGPRFNSSSVAVLTEFGRQRIEELKKQGYTLKGAGV